MATRISTVSSVSKWQVALCPHRAEDLQGAMIRNIAFEQEALRKGYGDSIVLVEAQEINHALKEIPRFRTMLGVSLYFVTLAFPFFLGAPEGALKMVTTAVVGACSPVLIYSAAKLYKLARKIPSVYPRVRPELLVRKIL